VEGTASAKYFFGIGGINKSGLISKARSKMLANAKLIGKSRAVINETAEININTILIYQEYIVTVSAYIIEFYDHEDDVTKIVKIPHKSSNIK
jgi:maleate cis-trans isomerase